MLFSKKNFKKYIKLYSILYTGLSSIIFSIILLLLKNINAPIFITFGVPTLLYALSDYLKNLIVENDESSPIAKLKKENTQLKKENKKLTDNLTAKEEIIAALRSTFTNHITDGSKAAEDDKRLIQNTLGWISSSNEINTTNHIDGSSVAKYRKEIESFNTSI